MSLLVDTSVWSLALRRDVDSRAPEVAVLRRALAGGEVVATTGVILQELLQGIVAKRSRTRITETFAALAYLTPTREDHVRAADVRNSLRSAGVQVGTIDALIAHLAMTGDHTLLTSDHDYHVAAKHLPLRVWRDDRGR